MTGIFDDLAGAVVDGDVLQHLGNPVAEQRLLAQGRAVAPLGDRRVLAVEGADRLSWLDSLSSQALTGLVPGASTELLILDPQGRIQHAAAAVDDGETTWLIADADDVDALLAWLLRMRFRLRVAPRDASDEMAVIGGTPAALAEVEAAAPAGVPLVWRDPWPSVAPGGHAYALADPHPGRERDWAETVVTHDERERLVRSAAAGEVALAGSVAAEALRIAAWRPRRADVDDRTLPHELDWLRTAVHLEKGCYRGQETVAKVHNLGHPPRRLVSLQLDGSESVFPVRGAAVRRADGAEAGAVTAVALHHEQGPVALALVRRSTPADETLTVDTDGGPVAAAQELIVPPDAGATASVPRIPRLGSRRAAAGSSSAP